MELDYVYARQLVHAYFVMLTVGCKRDDCTNENCCSNPQSPQLTATEAAIKSVYFATQAPEELHPETSEAEVPKFQQPEIITTESSATAEASARKSTPRRRLSVAVKLDNGLNKGRESPAKRPTIITRVAVQPKHKLTIDPATSLVKDDVRQRRLSRPKEKLFDAIKRSFSRTKKAPLGSA
ncbi:hypothetical protein PHYSODRAFT_521172 [Phytophthora sojae]|uniref:Ubiquitin-protein ligase E3A N-terminal zinc-binding domain-containing protein n=1 Tax=Phytophthora sojae (strain P6497) TaxID=1094619 RepID=G5A0T2_PHYSP|nr:hypothetical protein PHYSODRAFT_521172 [Phytophthora sojae]EGZ11418.1 hypothetical protein PHYSODRAFT_521172 [Phytophthora sojae]|eukprot:XP_009534163.1 hypothetical protein PHYSODRAFT_521172 [Phytophthora sojae]